MSARLYEGRKIDLHTHIGDFGGWANVSLTAENLVKTMEECNIEKSAVFFTDNELVRKAVKRYPKQLVGCVWPNPHEPTARETRQEGSERVGIQGNKVCILFSKHFFPTMTLFIQ